ELPRGPRVDGAGGVPERVLVLDALAGGRRRRRLSPLARLGGGAPPPGPRRRRARSVAHGARDMIGRLGDGALPPARTPRARSYHRPPATSARDGGGPGCRGRSAQRGHGGVPQAARIERSNASAMRSAPAGQSDAIRSLIARRRV